MPTTVNELFQNTNNKIVGQARWGEKIDSRNAGVYVIAMSETPDKLLYLDRAPISIEAVKMWIEYVPSIKLDNNIPITKELVDRLNEFWLPDETILYIGKAGTSLRQRINQYYRTKLGDPKPHAGGHWLKTLSILDNLNIYWTDIIDKPAHVVEGDFLKYFTDNVSSYSKAILRDSKNTFPFANLEYPKGTRKNHGIRKAVNR